MTQIPAFDAEFIYLSILGLIGLLLGVVGRSEKESMKKDFAHYMVNEWRKLLISAIVTMLTVYLRADIKEFFVITPLGAVITGYLGNSILLDIIKAKAPKIDESK